MAKKAVKKKRARKPGNKDPLDPSLAKLPFRHQVFVVEYVKTWNSSEAARRAGYKTRANTAGTRLMSNAVICEAISKRIKALAMQADETLLRIAEQARNEAAVYLKVNEAGLPYFDFKQCIADGKQYLIKKIKYDGNGNPEVELMDSQAALFKIGSHHGLFVDKMALTDPTGQKEYESRLSRDQLREAVHQLLTRKSTEPASELPQP
jgi:hypothetical protein